MNHRFKTSLPLTAALVGLLGLPACHPTGSGLGEWHCGELEAHVRFPKNQHQAIRVGDRVVPRIMGLENKLGLCLKLPSGCDASQWAAEIAMGGILTPLAAPAFQAGDVVCFEASIPPDLPPGSFELCGVVVDRYDGARASVPCQTLYFDPDTGDYERLMADFYQVGMSYGSKGASWALVELDEIARSAAEQGLLLLPVRCALLAAYLLEQQGDEASLAEARRRLGSLPSWLGDEGFGAWLARALHEDAKLEMRPGENVGAAWEKLVQAESLLRRTAEADWIGFVQTKTDLLARLGRPREAQQELRSAIELCQSLPGECRPGFLDLAFSQFVWLAIQNLDASPSELREIDAWLSGQKIGETFNLSEKANYWINRAHLKVLIGENPESFLDEAKGCLADVQSPARRSFLQGWSRLVEALDAFRLGRYERSAAICRDIQNAAEPRLYTRVWALQGEIHRRRGDSARALALFEAAFLHYESAYAPEPGQRPDLSPGFRTDMIHRAVRAAVDLGRLAEAWDLLASMDALADDERQRKRCRDASRDQEAWLEYEARLRRLQQALREAVEDTNDGQRIARLKQSIREARRQWPDCPAGKPQAYVQPDFRAVALEDELLLLRRHADGAVALAQRTALERRALQALFDALDNEAAQWGDAEWREKLMPLAEALSPAIDGVTEVQTIGLHGLLQRTPLDALPGVQAGTLAVMPAGVPESPRRVSEAARAPLIVLDPQLNLSELEDKLTFFEARFPKATLLLGEAADGEAMRVFGEEAAWLHVDAHGVYDSLFPEFSGLELADGTLTFSELEALRPAWRFANLSACFSGRWPVSDDSGRYGLAGLIAGLGAEWVVASRGALDDALARDFNQAYYAAISQGDAVPRAYAAALTESKKHYPPSQWSKLFLMAGRPMVDKNRDKGGQSE